MDIPIQIQSPSEKKRIPARPSPRRRLVIPGPETNQLMIRVRHAVDIAIAVQISGYFQGDIMMGVRGFAGQSDVEIDLVAASALWQFCDVIFRPRDGLIRSGRIRIIDKCPGKDVTSIEAGSDDGFVAFVVPGIHADISKSAPPRT